MKGLGVLKYIGRVVLIFLAISSLLLVFNQVVFIVSGPVKYKTLEEYNEWVDEVRSVEVDYYTVKEVGNRGYKLSLKGDSETLTDTFYFEDLNPYGDVVDVGDDVTRITLMSKYTTKSIYVTGIVEEDMALYLAHGYNLDSINRGYAESGNYTIANFIDLGLYIWVAWFLCKPVYLGLRNSKVPDLEVGGE